jgi:hypothetical protein
MWTHNFKVKRKFDCDAVEVHFKAADWGPCLKKLLAEDPLAIDSAHRIVLLL